MLKVDTTNLEEDRWISAYDASKLLAISEQTLAKWRQRDIGPPFAQVAQHQRILYRVSDLVNWMEQHTHRPKAIMTKQPKYRTPVDALAETA